MNIIDTIKELLGGASDHTQNIQDAVQGISEGDIAQQVKDGAGNIGTSAQDAATNIGEKVQEATTNLKDGLGK